MQALFFYILSILPVCHCQTGKSDSTGLFTLYWKGKNMAIQKRHFLGKRNGFVRGIGALAFALACVCPVMAQTNWPDTFNGLPEMGPYAWVDGPSEIAKNPGLSSVVLGGQEGPIKLYICRAQLQDGIHTGKFFNGQCNIGWGGKEVGLATGYQLLVNTQPALANLLPQTWVAPTTPVATTFHGGAVGNTQMRVCRASYNNGLHPGKEWAEKCHIGWGGQEMTIAPYEVLSLGFTKSNPSLTSSTTVVVQPAPENPTVTVTMPNLTTPVLPNLNLTPPPQPAPVVVTTLQRLTNVCLISLNEKKDIMMAPRLNYTDQSGITRSPKSFSRTEIAAKAQAGSGLEFRTSDSTSAITWFVKENIAEKPGWFRLRFLTSNLYVELASSTGEPSLIMNPYKDSPLQMFSIEKYSNGDALIARLPVAGGITNQLVFKDNQFEYTKYSLGIENPELAVTWPAAKMTIYQFMPLFIRTYPMWVYVNDGTGKAYPE